MPLSRTPTGGERTRSVSESDTDRISSAVLLLDPDNDPEKRDQSPILSQNANFDLSRSNPNISPPGSGMIETPLGVGLGTRFQTRSNPRALELQAKAERACKDLRKDVELWMTSMKANPPPRIAYYCGRIRKI